MNYKTLLLALVVALVNACHKDEPVSESSKGTLKLNVGLFISVNEIENKLKSTSGVEDFLVTIYNELGNNIMQFPRAADLPEEVELDPGEYYVTAHSNNELPAAFNNPYYYGESELFAITPGAQQTVSVGCEMANTMVTILYSDQVKSHYIDYVTTVSTSEGSLTYDRDETRPGYFKPLPMNISVVLTWQKDDGSTANKSLSGTIPNPQPKRNYEIHIDAASAYGEAFIQIDLDPLISDTEIIQINDEGSSVPGLVAEGDLIITEIMANPDALDDSDGEWFEIYNTTSEAIDLFHLVIRKNTTDHHVINTNITAPPFGYLVLARSAGAVASPGYVYGSAVSLNNTGATLSLLNYGTNGNDGSLICSVNYEATGFPHPAGASISLLPSLLDYIYVASADSWCISTSPYSTGDLGTPGWINDNCR